MGGSDWAGAESLAERRIREAIARGEFDDLPGAGRPLDLGRPDDPDWWLNRYLRRENVDAAALLPAAILLRREADGFPDSLADLPDEAAVRAVLSDFNRRVAEELRRPRRPSEPPVYPHTVDVEELLARWRQLRGSG